MLYIATVTFHPALDEGHERQKEDVAMEERRKLINWVKEHKKELIIAGISVTALILLILGIKHRAEIKALWESLKRAAPETAVRMSKAAVEVPPEPLKDVIAAVALNSETLPFEVRRHIRNLPDGWHASPEKIAEALKNSIILMDGQTWVDSYMKGGVAA